MFLTTTLPAPAAWWETGFDRWYHKDDWKAQFLSGGRQYGTTITIPAEFEAAWVEVWSSAEYVLTVNTEVIGADRDSGTVEAYDLTEVLHLARNQIEIRASREVIVDGGVVLTDGQIVPIRSDETWGIGRRKIRASAERRTGPSGYAGNAHQALMLDYTPEQRAKAQVSRLNALVGRLRDRDTFRFWQVCDPAEALALSGPAYEICQDVIDDTDEATTTADLAEAAIARGEFDKVESILNALPRRVGLHTIDTASDLEIATKLRSLRNDATALRIQLALMLRGAIEADPSWMPRVREIERRVRQTFDESTSARLLPHLAAELHQQVESLRTEIEGVLGTRLDPLNRSTQNPLGWVISNTPLDNDPRRWEFSFDPLSADVLDLSGAWRFRLDPERSGLEDGFAKADLDDSEWDRIIAPYAWGWERLGYDRDNPDFRGRNNKPYNGNAWYRKQVFIPERWRDRDLELDLGVRESNRDWLFVNGSPVGDEAMRKDGTKAGRFTIPASMLRPGGRNRLAIRVYNDDNRGGLLGPRVQLYPVGSRPKRTRTVCQAGIIQSTDFGSGARQVAYCGALHPAVLVTQTEKQFRIWGWESKGYPAPAFLAHGSGLGVRLYQTKVGLTIPGSALDKPWIVLAPDAKEAEIGEIPQVLLIVFQHRPKEIRWESDGFGGSAMVVDFEKAPGIIGLSRPLGPVVPVNRDDQGEAYLRPFTDSICNRWAGTVRAYPISFAELYIEQNGKALVQVGYDHLKTDDDWNTEKIESAPIPMLFTYARENSRPGVASDIYARLSRGAANTADPSETYCGAYMTRLGTPAVSLEYDIQKPRVHWKGIGSWTEIREKVDRDFAQLRSWGANASRPQIAFDREWYVEGFFEGAGKNKSGLEGRVRWGDGAVAWLDQLVDRHRRYGILCILNWFWNADYAMDEINGAPPNSSRYWRHKPEARQVIIDFWSKVAEHYANLPRDAVAYDLLNEPATLEVDDYNRFIKDATTAIREQDTTHTIFVESANSWAQVEAFDRLEATGDENTIYEFHFYGPHKYDEFEHDIWFPRYERERESFHSWESLEERILPAIRFSIRNGGAELCHGEFGITFLGPGDSPRRWLETLLTLHEKYQTHWIWWTWDSQSIHRTGLVSGSRVNPLIGTLSEFMKM